MTALPPNPSHAAAQQSLIARVREVVRRDALLEAARYLRLHGEHQSADILVQLVRR